MDNSKTALLLSPIETNMRSEGCSEILILVIFSRDSYADCSSPWLNNHDVTKGNNVYKSSVELQTNYWQIICWFPLAFYVHARMNLSNQDNFDPVFPSCSK